MRTKRISNPQQSTRKLKQQSSLPILPRKQNLYTPKHLNVSKKKVNSVKNLIYEMPIADKILKEKKRFLKPLTDIELILKKFDEVVVEDKQIIFETPKKIDKIQKRFETDLDKKIKGLLTLPTITKIKKQAHQYLLKSEQNDSMVFTAMISQGHRLNIVNNYGLFLQSSSKPFESRRLKTEAPSPTMSPLKLY